MGVAARWLLVSFTITRSSESAPKKAKAYFWPPFLCSFRSVIFVCLKSAHLIDPTFIATISTLVVSLFVSRAIMFINKIGVTFVERFVR